ncbi:MAG TPA: HEAT repeat domain-containing protein, partial [Planctomycetota bacterium]|nr:HEAT repeat domain-containing protein [Planctomycetota bacterium]
LMERSIHRPFLLQQAAVALGCLGDKRATPLLQELLGKNESAAALAAIAGALAFIGDRRSIDPLIKLLQDEQLTKLARAFAAAALGGVGDRYELPWNVGLSVDNNYQAAVDTMTNGRNGVLDIL